MGTGGFVRRKLRRGSMVVVVVMGPARGCWFPIRFTVGFEGDWSALIWCVITRMPLEFFMESSKFGLVWLLGLFAFNGSFSHVGIGIVFG